LTVRIAFSAANATGAQPGPAGALSAKGETLDLTVLIGP